MLSTLLLLTAVFARSNFGPETNDIHHSIVHSNVNQLTSFSSSTDHVTDAKLYAASVLGLSAEDFIVTDDYASGNLRHVYLQQVYNGIPVANGHDNKIISFGSSCISSFHLNQQFQDQDGQLVITQHELISPINALDKFMKSINKNLNIQQTSILSVLNSDPNIYTISSEYGEITTRLMWIQESNMLKKVWQFDIDLTESWYSVSIDAQTGNVIQQIDWVSDVEAAKSYKYKVFPLGTNDPTQGDPVTITNPANHQASKNGWHFSNKEYKTTIGNNVFAQDNVDGGNSHLSNHRPESKKFSFVYDYEVQKGPKSYIDMSITNLFYWCNTIHDLFYLYGFDEQSGNFQTVNEAGKGKGSDAVIANAQDGSGTNNANFATPPDGRPGRMRMYIWDVTNPSRDGDLEGGIIVHEYMHGISTRLTGGPANSNCLGFGEAGGMGEGWGDFFATILRHTSNTTRDDVYGMGEWVAGGKGIRKFSYSTDLKINPSTYSYVNKPAYFGVHAKGEVWAVILYEVYWNVVEKYGFTQDWFGNSDTYVNLATGVQEKSNKSTETFGNRLMMKIVILGMKLQPCNPTFVTARDAIIEAFVQEEPEGDVCLLWKGFAKRGLGYEAKSGFGGKESFKLPSTCV